jgi:hypothetical protein
MKCTKLIISVGLILALFVIGIAGAAEKDIPNLIGTWTVSTTEGDSMLSNYTNASAIMINKIKIVIETQNGQVFEGYTEKLVGAPNNVSTIKEGMSGIISDDMAHAYIKQYTDGLSFADITSPDTMTIYSLFEMGPLDKENPGVSRIVLIKEKNV